LPHEAKQTLPNIFAKMQLSGRFRTWIGYWSPLF